MNINSHVAGLHKQLFISDAEQLSIYHKDGTKNLKFTTFKFLSIQLKISDCSAKEQISAKVKNKSEILRDKLRRSMDPIG
jgi:hypothetical protein